MALYINNASTYESEAIYFLQSMNLRCAGRAPGLSASAEGEVARLRRHGGRHRWGAAAAAAPARLSPAAARGASRQGGGRRGIGVIWG